MRSNCARSLVSFSRSSLNRSVVRRARVAAGGTLLAAEMALQHGMAGSAAGGSHHGQRSAGAGFCVFNDVAIADLALKQAYRIRKALIVDLSVHQGDGTADCLNADPDLFTFSLHWGKNCPVRKYQVSGVSSETKSAQNNPAAAKGQPALKEELACPSSFIDDRASGMTERESDKDWNCIGRTPSIYFIIANAVEPAKAAPAMNTSAPESETTTGSHINPPHQCWP